MSAPATRLPAMARFVVVLPELVIAVCALGGGGGLVAGNAIRMADDWLVGTPFTSWTLPGLLLLAVVCVPMSVAAVLELRRSAWAAVVSVGAGAAQIGWIAAQLLIMQRYFVLQPVLLAGGLAVLLLTLWAHRERPLLPPRRGTSRFRPRRDGRGADLRRPEGLTRVGTGSIDPARRDRAERRSSVPGRGHASRSQTGGGKPR